MKLLWKIQKSDIKKVKSFYKAHRNNVFVLNRINSNVKKKDHVFSKVEFWQWMIVCLITTQQRSGPDSAVSRFILTKPFPLTYSKCKQSANLKKSVERVITNFGGLRRAKRISDEVEYNFRWLENNGWPVIKKMVQSLGHKHTPKGEREWAEEIAKNLKGFGPKQSRNLLQTLGLTKYETPIDSRITKWLNDFGFPIKLSAAALADKNYYNFVMDGFQKICEESGIYPCEMMLPYLQVLIGNGLKTS